MEVTMIKGGFTLWARQSIDSDIFFYKPDKWFKIWFFIVNSVNYKKNKLFERGQNLITYEDIMRKTKATKTQTYKAIRFFKEKSMIDAEKTTRGFIIKVLNYSKYQCVENYTDDRETIERRLRDDREANTITKERKKENKEINTYMSSFNGKFKSSYQVTSGRDNKLSLRLKKFTLEEILKALDNLSKSKFHQGYNDRGWKADPDFLIRSDEQVDKWLNAKPEQETGDINSLLKL